MARTKQTPKVVKKTLSPYERPLPQNETVPVDIPVSVETTTAVPETQNNQVLSLRPIYQRGCIRALNVINYNMQLEEKKTTSVTELYEEIQKSTLKMSGDLCKGRHSYLKSFFYKFLSINMKVAWESQDNNCKLKFKNFIYTLSIEKKIGFKQTPDDNIFFVDASNMDSNLSPTFKFPPIQLKNPKKESVKSGSIKNLLQEINELWIKIANENNDEFKKMYLSIMQTMQTRLLEMEKSKKQ